MSSATLTHRTNGLPWQAGRYYAANTAVVHNGGVFLAKTGHTATEIGDEPGVFGMEGDWNAYWTCIAWYDAPRLTLWHEGSTEGKLVSVRGNYGAITPQMTTSQWTAATVSTTGAPSINNTIEDGFRMTLTTTGATAALLRQYAAMTFNRNWLPGKNSEIDWTKPFRVRIPLRLEIGGTGSGFKMTLFIGGLSAAPTVHTMSGKGLAVCIIGTGAGAGTIQLGAHNGTSQVDCAAVAETFNGTLRNLEVVHLPGTGALLFVGSTYIGTVASAALPAGVSSSANGWAVLFEHTTATVGTSNLNLHQFTIEYLAP